MIESSWSPGDLPPGYEFVDLEDYGEEAYALARGEIGVLSGKELHSVVADEESGEVAAAMFNEFSAGEYSFDIVVARPHRRKGLAKTLAQTALSDYVELRDSLGATLSVEVVDPGMRRILERLGLVVVKKLRSGVVMMSDAEVVEEMARVARGEHEVELREIDKGDVEAWSGGSDEVRRKIAAKYSRELLFSHLDDESYETAEVVDLRRAWKDRVVLKVVGVVEDGVPYSLDDLPEKIVPRGTRLYHGTTKGSAKGILKSGLRTSKAGGLGKGAYLTEIEGEARFWSRGGAVVTFEASRDLRLVDVGKSAIRSALFRQLLAAARDGGADSASEQLSGVERDLEARGFDGVWSSGLGLAVFDVTPLAIVKDAGLAEGNFSENTVTINVPRSALSHFWEEPAAGSHGEFWAFRSKPDAAPGDAIVFMVGGKRVASARVASVEPPGSSKCSTTGRFGDRWKLHWRHADFVDERGLSEALVGTTGRRAIAEDLEQWLGEQVESVDGEATGRYRHITYSELKKLGRGESIGPIGDGPGRRALLLMHVDSIESYAAAWTDAKGRQMGRAIAEELVEEWKHAVATAKGRGDKVYVVRGGGFGGDSRYMNSLYAAIGDAEYIEFDEAVQSWKAFEKKLIALIRRDEITEVDLGGIWYSDCGTTGCATEAGNILRRRGVKVTPDRDLLGYEPKDEDYDPDDEMVESFDDDEPDEPTDPISRRAALRKERPEHDPNFGDEDVRGTTPRRIVAEKAAAVVARLTSGVGARGAECKTSWDINNGLCADFADELRIAVGDGRVVYAWTPWDDYHWWFECAGWHYDAETPGGVRNWRDLGFWKNWVAGEDERKRVKAAGGRDRLVEANVGLAGGYGLRQLADTIYREFTKLLTKVGRDLGYKKSDYVAGKQDVSIKELPGYTKVSSPEQTKDRTTFLKFASPGDPEGVLTLSVQFYEDSELGGAAFEMAYGHSKNMIPSLQKAVSIDSVYLQVNTNHVWHSLVRTFKLDGLGSCRHEAAHVLDRVLSGKVRGTNMSKVGRQKYISDNGEIRARAAEVALGVADLMTKNPDLDFDEILRRDQTWRWLENSARGGYDVTKAKRYVLQKAREAYDRAKVVGLALREKKRALKHKRDLRKPTAAVKESKAWLGEAAAATDESRASTGARVTLAEYLADEKVLDEAIGSKSDHDEVVEAIREWKGDPSTWHAEKQVANIVRLLSGPAGSDVVSASRAIASRRAGGDKLTLFRGSTEVDSLALAGWSTDSSVAIKFALRHRGELCRAVVSVDHVAYCDGALKQEVPNQQEEEVILFPDNDLRVVKCVSVSDFIDTGDGFDPDEVSDFDLDQIVDALTESAATPVEAKSVDAVVFHGTKRDFDEFDPGKTGSRHRLSDTRSGDAIFFTSSEEFAREIAGSTGRVIRARVRMERPMRRHVAWIATAEVAEFLKEARKSGCDGLVVTADSNLVGDFYIAFSKDQVEILDHGRPARTSTQRVASGLDETTESPHGAFVEGVHSYQIAEAIARVSPTEATTISEATMYHGTTAKAMKQIMAVGEIRPHGTTPVERGSVRSLPMVYLSKSEASARRWAESRAKSKRSVPVVLQVSLPESDLLPDEDFIIAMMSAWSHRDGAGGTSGKMAVQAALWDKVLSQVVYREAKLKRTWESKLKSGHGMSWEDDVAFAKSVVRRLKMIPGLNREIVEASPDVGTEEPVTDFVVVPGQSEVAFSESLEDRTADEMKLWSLTPKELMDKALFHGTGAGFDGPLRGGGDNITWFAEAPDVAQAYIPATGSFITGWVGSYENEKDALRATDDALLKIAKLKGYEHEVIKDKHLRPLQVVWKGEKFTYGMARDAMRELGYDPHKVGTKLRLDKDEVKHAEYKRPGRVFLALGKEKLKLFAYDEEGPDEGLVDPQYNHLSAFRKIEKRGYDGLRINDFVSTDHWGPVNHKSIGVFNGGGLDKLQVVMFPGKNFDWPDSLVGWHGMTDDFLAWHKTIVEKALADGRNVPKEVLRAHGLDEGGTLTEVRSRPGGWYGPVYHGSRHKFLRRIDPKQAGTGVVTYGPRGPVSWFTSSKENALFYTDPKRDDDDPRSYVYEAYLRMANPLIVKPDEENVSSSPALWVDHAKDEGHDGLIMVDVNDPDRSDVYAVWDAAQVKLVGPLAEPILSHDEPVDEDHIEILSADHGYVAAIYADDSDETDLVGPYPTRAEAKAAASRVIASHNRRVAATRSKETARRNDRAGATLAEHLGIVESIDTVRLGDLPDDMVVLIMQFMEEFGNRKFLDKLDDEDGYDDLRLPVVDVDVASFPEVEMETDYRSIQHAMEMNLDETPPVLVGKGVWLDGRHRVYKAKQDGRKTIKAVDLSSVLPRLQASSHRHLGKVNRGKLVRYQPSHLRTTEDTARRNGRVDATLAEGSGPTFKKSWRKLGDESESILWAREEVESDDLDEDDVEEELLSWGRSRFDDALNVARSCGGRSCWRAVTLQDGVDPMNPGSVGKHWSLSRDGARAYYGDDDKPEVVYQGKVVQKDVDVEATVVARMNFISGDDEDEVTMLPGREVLVTSVEIRGKKTAVGIKVTT